MLDLMKCLFEVDNIVEQIVLVLKVFLNEYSTIEYLLNGTSSFPETSFFIG